MMSCVQQKSGCWFQTFFIFTPSWGTFLILTSIFFKGVGSTTNQKWVIHSEILATDAKTFQLSSDHFTPDSAVGLCFGDDSSYPVYIGITLPKTNSSPLKMVVSNRNLLFQGSIFRGYVSFREGISQAMK